MAADEDHFSRRPTAAGRPRPCLHSDGRSRTASEFSSPKAAHKTRSKKVSSGLVTERTAASERAAALPPMKGLGLLTELLRSLDNVVEGKEGSAFVTAPPLTKADARHLYDNALHQSREMSRNLHRSQSGGAPPPSPRSSSGEAPLQPMTIRDGTRTLLPVALPSPMPGWQRGVTMSAIALLVSSHPLLAPAGHLHIFGEKGRPLSRQRHRSAPPQEATTMISVVFQVAMRLGHSLRLSFCCSRPSQLPSKSCSNGKSDSIAQDNPPWMQQKGIWNVIS